MRILKCRLRTIETLLGTASNNKELHSEFIASQGTGCAEQRGGD